LILIILTVYLSLSVNRLHSGIDILILHNIIPLITDK
jgi:hypothetical protein